MKKMNIPVGVSDFEEIRKNGYYYIDKSGLVRELLSRTGTKVTLITRPRRFGKTLGMSMLESFFDIRKDEFVCSGAVKGGGNNCRRLISRKEIGRLLILRKTVL